MVPVASGRTAPQVVSRFTNSRRLVMKPFVLSGLSCVLVILVGCGPMQAPLPPRLEPEAQKGVDDSWNRAFTPPDKLGHQDLLDVLVGTQAYQLGVDTFTIRAEKVLTGGKVVMEVWFDRSKPDNDRFEVSVHDAAGQLVRTERYMRGEIEETYNALFSKDHGQTGRDARQDA